MGVRLNKTRRIVMSIKTKLQQNDGLRLSNAQSNKITKESIESAILLLMKERDFKDISISDIVKRAGVSRTAYYRNYKSKEDILNKYLETVVKAITNEMDFTTYSEDRIGFWYSIFSKVRDHSEIYLILHRAGFEGIILSNINNLLLAGISSDNINSKDKYDVYFWAGAVYNILTEWITSGMKETDKEMAQICCEILAEVDLKP